MKLDFQANLESLGSLWVGLLSNQSTICCQSYFSRKCSISLIGSLFMWLNANLLDWSSKGLSGKDGLDGLPGNDGVMVSTTFRVTFLYFLMFLVTKTCSYTCCVVGHLHFVEWMTNGSLVSLKGRSGERGADGFPGKPGSKVQRLNHTGQDWRHMQPMWQCPYANMTF